MGATHALAPLELQGIERRRLQRAEEGVAQEMGGLKRVQGQITSQEQVEESREVAKDLHLDQEREVHKDQGPLLENQEVEEVESKVEVVESKLEEAEGKGEEVEVVEKQLPALERNCRFLSFLMSRQWILVQLKCSGLHRRLPGFQRASLWRVCGWVCKALRQVISANRLKPINALFVPLLRPSIQKTPIMN